MSRVISTNPVKLPQASKGYDESDQNRTRRQIEVALRDLSTAQTTGSVDLNATDKLTTRGDLLTRDATGYARLAIGATGKFLRSNGTDASWQSLALTAADIDAGVFAGSGASTYQFNGFLRVNHSLGLNASPGDQYGIHINSNLSGFATTMGLRATPNFASDGTTELTVLYAKGGVGSFSTFTTTDVFGLRLDTFSKGSSQTITNWTGLQIEAGPTATNKWALRTIGSELVSFGGDEEVAGTVFAKASKSSFGTLIASDCSFAGLTRAQIIRVGSGGVAQLGRVNTSIGSPSGVLSGEAIGVLAFAGYDTSALSNGASLTANATENWSGSARGSKLTFAVTPNGSTSASNALVIDQDLSATFSGLLVTAASTTGQAGARIPSGTAPTSPVSGDIWYDGTNLKFRDGGTTRTITWT